MIEGNTLQKRHPSHLLLPELDYRRIKFKSLYCTTNTEPSFLLCDRPTLRSAELPLPARPSSHHSLLLTILLVLRLFWYSLINILKLFLWLPGKFSNKALHWNLIIFSMSWVNYQPFGEGFSHSLILFGFPWLIFPPWPFTSFLPPDICLHTVSYATKGYKLHENGALLLCLFMLIGSHYAA